VCSIVSYLYFVLHYKVDYTVVRIWFGLFTLLLRVTWADQALLGSFLLLSLGCVWVAATRWQLRLRTTGPLYLTLFWLGAGRGGFCNVGSETQDLVHARQVFHH
jgi:hypothetical protein